MRHKGIYFCSRLYSDLQLKSRVTDRILDVSDNFMLRMWIIILFTQSHSILIDKQKLKALPISCAGLPFHLINVNSSPPANVL